MNEAKILQFDSKGYEVACARMAADPLALTERDFEQLDIVSPGLVRDAHRAQEFARQERARLAQVKTATPKKPQPLTRKDLDWIGDVFIDTIKKSLDARIAPLEAHTRSLEQRVSEQANRILELEAEKFAGHVER